MTDISTGKPFTAVSLTCRRPNITVFGHRIALWTGQTGDQVEALLLFQELLSDLQRVLGPDHPSTLIARGNIAGLIGQTGDPAEALRQFQELLPDIQRVLGPDHPDTITTRNNIAYWTGQTEDRPGANTGPNDRPSVSGRLCGRVHGPAILCTGDALGTCCHRGLGLTIPDQVPTPLAINEIRRH